MKEELLRIGQLAQLTAKTTRALHLYEELDLLEPACRTEGGFRLYDVENVARIRYIDSLKRLGYSLTQIRELVVGWREGDTPRNAMASMEAIYSARLEEVRSTIAELGALESELVRSLAFLQGCHTCDADADPAVACGDCERTGDGLALITGLAAH